MIYQRELKISHIYKGASTPVSSVQFCTVNNFTEQLRQKKSFLVEEIYLNRNDEGQKYQYFQFEIRAKKFETLFQKN